MGARVAVIGAGWSGLAAALEATSLGAAVTLFEMAPAAGGRARDLNAGSDDGLDNGQHICIGAYTETLRLMAAIYRTVLDEIERDGYHVLNQRISLTPLRKLWLAWKTYVRG